jgi:uncharacterized membrane protein
MKGMIMADQNAIEYKNPEHWANFILPIVLISGLVALLTFVSDQPIEELTSVVPQEDWIANIAGYVIVAAEGGAALIIGTSVVTGIISYFKHLFDPMDRQINSTERIRLRMGHMLNLGLEFAMASDILRLAVSPSTGDVIILLAIVLLRILLNYFLEREIRSSEEFCGPGDFTIDFDE